MAEVAPVAATAPAKAPQKKAAAKPKKAGPCLGELIVRAVSASEEKSGVSLAALKKALVAGGYDVEKNRSRVKVLVKGLVIKGTLVHTKGTGAAGSFKINKVSETKVRKSTKKVATPKVKEEVTKKPAVVKKPKKAVANKPAAAKKSPKKAKKPAGVKIVMKSPKKAKKPAAPKKSVAESPKKAAKAAKPEAAKPKTKESPKKK